MVRNDFKVKDFEIKRNQVLVAGGMLQADREQDVLVYTLIKWMVQETTCSLKLVTCNLKRCTIAL
ncbi:hypothetical protein BH09BAC3_BH09BAC3_28770 [soil metagenome]